MGGEAEKKTVVIGLMLRLSFNNTHIWTSFITCTVL
jgi:hypothetical protein